MAMSFSNLVFVLLLLIGLNGATLQPQMNWVCDEELLNKLSNDANLKAGMRQLGNLSAEVSIEILKVAVVDNAFKSNQQKSNPEKVLALCKVSKEILKTEYFYAAVLLSTPKVSLKSIGRENAFHHATEVNPLVSVQVAAEWYAKLVYAFQENWFPQFSCLSSEITKIETTLRTKYYRHFSLDINDKVVISVFLSSFGAATLAAIFNESNPTSTEPKTVNSIWDVYSAAVMFLENQLALFPAWKTEQHELDEYQHLGSQIIGAAPWIPSKYNMSLYAINTAEVGNGYLGVIFQCFGDFPATGFFTAWTETGNKQHTLRHVGTLEKIEDAAVTYLRYRKRCQLPLAGEVYTKGVEWLSQPGPFLNKYVENFHDGLLSRLPEAERKKYLTAKPVRFGLLPSAIKDSTTKIELYVIWKLENTAFFLPMTLDTSDGKVGSGVMGKQLTSFMSFSATEFAMHNAYEVLAGTHSAKQSRIVWSPVEFSYGDEALAAINENQVLPSMVTDFQTCLAWWEKTFKRVNIVKCKVDNTPAYFYVAQSKFGVASNPLVVNWYGEIWKCTADETECFRNAVADAESYILDRAYSFQEVWDWNGRCCKVGKDGVVKIERIGDNDVQFRFNVSVEEGTKSQTVQVTPHGNKHSFIHQAMQELGSYLSEPLPFVSWSKPTENEQFRKKMAPLLEEFKPKYDLVLRHVKQKSNMLLLLLQGTGENGNSYLASALDDGTKFVAEGELREITKANQEDVLHPTVLATKPTNVTIRIHWEAVSGAESKLDERQLQSVMYAAPWTQHFQKIEIHVTKKSSIPNQVDATASICYLINKGTEYWFFIIWIGPRLIHVGGLLHSADDASISLTRYLQTPLALKEAVFMNGIGWYPPKSEETQAVLKIISTADEFMEGDKANFSLWRIGVIPATRTDLENSWISYCVIVRKYYYFFPVVTKSKLKPTICEYNRTVSRMASVETPMQAEMEILRYITTKHKIPRI